MENSKSDCAADSQAASEILELAKSKGALLFGEFRLSAGGMSGYYFDGRILTLDPEGGYRVAQAFLSILRECGAEAIAGPTLGADPIVSAVSVVSQIEGHPIPGLIVRKEAKGYGGKRAIEGPTAALCAGAPVAVVDDTCTTAASLFHAIEAVESAGYRVVKVLSILDRNEGGRAELRRRGYSYQSLLSADENGEIVPSA